MAPKSAHAEGRVEEALCPGSTTVGGLEQFNYGWGVGHVVE